MECSSGLYLPFYTHSVAQMCCIYTYLYCTTIFVSRSRSDKNAFCGAGVCGRRWCGFVCLCFFAPPKERNTVQTGFPDVCRCAMRISIKSLFSVSWHISPHLVSGFYTVWDIGRNGWTLANNSKDNKQNKPKTCCRYYKHIVIFSQKVTRAINRNVWLLYLLHLFIHAADHLPNDTVHLFRHRACIFVEERCLMEILSTTEPFSAPFSEWNSRVCGISFRSTTPFNHHFFAKPGRAQRLCESGGGIPCSLSLIVLLVSVDVKQHWT